MRKDHVAGSVVALVLLGGIFASSYFYKREAPEPPPIVTVKPAEPLPRDVVIIEDVVRTEVANDPQKQPGSRGSELGESDRPFQPPPQLPDRPVPLEPGHLTQPIQPGPIEGAKPTPNQKFISTVGDGEEGELGSGPIIDYRTLDRKPEPRLTISPQYPHPMRASETEGEVVVEFIVDANGDVRNPVVVRSSQREFEEAALQAISKWKFRPGMKAGRVVNTGRVQQLILFTLGQ